VRLSLLDRGFAFAIAHIRGGEEMGRYWYEDGKLLKKKNTFTDFIDCAEYLLQGKYTSQDKLFAMGGSAGGLLMGAVVNMRPDLWRGVIAAVPFVDVVTTMLDESIPLTTGEFDEWGNPKNKEYYDYIKSYSPYDNVEAKAYPPMLVTTGLHDSQVQYWEPAKWVAKLRELKTDKNPLLLHTNMDAGHGGASGRYQRYRETAMEYAFMLDLVGANESGEEHKD
ncbi:MAG: S9 family peptidase, partial [Phaeodactylibacter sp.]|nr:S9 family peptidase [Phaeodactylibacter sp.]